MIFEVRYKAIGFRDWGFRFLASKVYGTGFSVYRV